MDPEIIDAAAGELVSFTPWWLWPFLFLGPLLWVLQLGCIIHAFKTGKPYYWIWFLFIAPGLAGAAYLFLEIQPRVAWRKQLRNLRPRSWAINELREKIRMLLPFSPSERQS